MKKDNIAGLIAILVGMLIFKATTYIDSVESFISDKPLIVIGAALVLFFYRIKIADKIGGKNG